MSPPVGAARSGVVGAQTGDALPDSDLYHEGEGEDDWVAGFTRGNGTQSKETDHLYLEIDNNPDAAATRTWATDAVVSTSVADTLEIELAIPTNEGEVIIMVGGDQDNLVDDASEELESTTSRTTITLDISSLSEDEFVKVAVNDNRGDANEHVEAEIYRVELTV